MTNNGLRLGFLVINQTPTGISDGGIAPFLVFLGKSSWQKGQSANREKLSEQHIWPKEFKPGLNKQIYKVGGKMLRV